MGFFSKVLDPLGMVDKASSALGGLFEDGEPARSGFSVLPREIQGAYKDYATKLTGMMPNAGGAFTPLPTTGDEQSAYSAIRGGFAPNQQSIGSDVAMQMNPFDDYVINDINREAGGDYSILKQALDTSGGFGSNRQLLGANDIDLTRLNQIGRFKQDQYNAALDNAMTTLPSARAQDARNLMGIADRERGLDTQTKQADMNGLLALAQALGVLPQSGGTITPQKNTGLQDLASLAGGVGGAMAAFSDSRLKENIKLIGQENGYNIYEFNYIGKPETWRGVLAQEVLKITPEAVIAMDDGYYAVDYGKIGIEFRRVA